MHSILSSEAREGVICGYTRYTLCRTTCGLLRTVYSAYCKQKVYHRLGEVLRYRLCGKVIHRMSQVILSKEILAYAYK